MPKVDWSSLIADPQGRIDYDRLRGLVAVLLGLAGGVVLVLILAGIVVANEQTAIIAGMLVVPITGGQVAAGIRGVVERHRSRAIISGAAPSRRAADRPSQGLEEVP